MALRGNENDPTEYPNLTKTIKLIRFMGFGIEVPGVLISKNLKTFCTLENKNYLFNDGYYELVYEYSPKFKKHLWELKNVKGRSEIKIHEGNHINATKGCVLLRSADLDHFHTTLDTNETYILHVQTEKQ